MSKTTIVGAFCLLGSIVTLFLGAGLRGWFALAAAVTVLVIGLRRDRRVRRSRALGPAVNWAEEFTAQVRRERAAARDAAVS
jgi:hypothetical protein